ncbi:uncharacterized protein LOC110467600 [Lonchura striata]
MSPRKDKGNSGNLPVAAAKGRGSQGSQGSQGAPQMPREHRELPQEQEPPGAPPHSPTRLGGSGPAHAQAAGAPLSPWRRRLHGGAAAGGEPMLVRTSPPFQAVWLLGTPPAWTAKAAASRLRQTQYAAAALREEELAAHGVSPPPFGRDAWPRGRRAGSCGVRWWLLPSKPDESNGSWSVTGACTNMTKRCPKSMASSMFCRKFGISQK